MQPQTDHKDVIVIKNKYYPKGVSQQNIWNYYQKVKRLILNEVRNREVMIMFAVSQNNFVIKRKLSNGSPISINSRNYNKVISGRTVSLHAAMRRFENFGIVDIDCDIFELAKRATYDVAMHFIKQMSTNRVSVYFTGKESFHVKIMLQSNTSIDRIKDFLRNSMLQSSLSKKYTISHKRHIHIPNLDLCIDKQRGNFIIPNALSIWGLKSVKVAINKIRDFRKESARIETR